jgi:U3 small nucleolar RNA-associated protein 11
LLKELSARLGRDRQLGYAGRELEMQRLLMGKGGRKKFQGVEKVEDDDDKDESEDDDLDGGERRATAANEKTYRPREYKWRMERKR